MHPSIQQTDHAYISRCLQLAAKGAGYVAPNPMVGAVLVHEGRILAEGWHQRYGEPHAEVNCLRAVGQEDRRLIAASTLYVSLEPCAHYGKTPPCADLIVKHKIPRVVIGCIDTFAKVAGKGVEKLRDAGIEVITEGPWTPACVDFNRQFFTFHEKKRPYILLKWAQTADQFIAPAEQRSDQDRLLISSAATNRLVHQWRSKSSAILVGKTTVLKDDPLLSNRYYPGPSPVKMVLDPDLQIARTASIFKGPEPVVVFNFIRSAAVLKTKDDSPLPGAQEDLINFPLVRQAIYYVRLENERPIAAQIAAFCYRAQLQSLLVEGGRQLLTTFIDENLWDQTRVITSTQQLIHQGLAAPELKNSELLREFHLGQDKISYFAPALSTGQMAPTTK